MNNEASRSGRDSWSAPQGAPVPDLGPDPAEPVKPSLLFIDDDTYMRRLMSVRLERLGAQVESLPSAQAALAFLQTHRPDVIISDAVMPGMDGFELCRQIKENPLLESIPFVILTALTRDLRQRSIQAGADDFLSKREIEVVFRLRARLALNLGSRIAAGGAEPEPATAPRLLVVSTAKLIQTQLETHLQKDGIQVECAASLKEAIGQLQAAVPDAMAVDFTQDPKVLAEWIGQVRALPGCANLNIMALATKEAEAGLAALEELVQDRLLKPLDGQESRHRVKYLIRVARS
jgi:two-component system, cell cycle response regulator